MKIKKFGTAPVFFTAISTILGAILFLRFGFAVGNVGFLGAVAIILIGHAVTIPTAMAIAEIATNQKVEGGGEYFIISRSFGLVIGSSIGLALYLSQAISVAFYIMAFAEAFTSFFNYLMSNYDLPGWLIWLLEKKQTIGIPALLILAYIMLTKGANLGVKALYIVVATLIVSLIAFFIGHTDYSLAQSHDLFKIPKDSINFFVVFAIIFPAFTGMTAGVGLSGDLKNPGKSIPLGTLSATIAGMIIYIFVAYKLAISASSADLADTSKLVISEIAWQGWWIIPLGLAAATISSALGSIMVAPRTLQAIAKDKIFPTPKVNNWLKKGKGNSDEPVNASLITLLIASVFILIGSIDNVAKIISMFFMVTYGSLSLISFLNHFSADPSYRPKFKSRWYISLFGAIASFGLMFFMNPGYAFIAIVLMFGLYFTIAHYNKDKKSLSLIFQGVIFQISHKLQVFLQKAEKEQTESWRPSVVAISKNTFKRLGGFDLLRWISQKYGFGTYIHQIEGYLSKETYKKAQEEKQRLIKMSELTNSNIYVDSIVSPSFTSSIAQIIQLPGIAGTENNLLLFEFSKNNPDELNDIIVNFNLIKSVDFDVMILAASDRGFGLQKEIHIWIGSKDYQNANLMILIAYILIGHKDWKGAKINIFAIYPEDEIEKEKERLYSVIEKGQLPISKQNISFISRKPDIKNSEIINERSKDADLTIVGFRPELIKKYGIDIFLRYNNIGNVLFVFNAKTKVIK